MHVVSWSAVGVLKLAVSLAAVFYLNRAVLRYS